MDKYAAPKCPKCGSHNIVVKDDKTICADCNTEIK